MKKQIRAAAAFLLVVMLAGVFTAPVGAKEIFVNQSKAPATETPASVEKPVAKPVGAPQSSLVLPGFPVTPDTTPAKPVSSVIPFVRGYGFPVDCGQQSTLTPCGYPSWYIRPQPKDIVGCGRYYTVADAKADIDRFVADRTYDVTILMGDSRSFCEGLYMVSDNPRVVSWNPKTQKLTANSHGSAYVYLYTQSGSPVGRMLVYTLADAYAGKHPDILNVSAEHWNIQPGDTTKINYTSTDGKKYSDIRYRVMYGPENVILNEQTGELKGFKEGFAAIRAYSKSDDRIYGDAIVYVGQIGAAVYDGYWKTCKDGIRVDKWGYDIRDIFTREQVCVSGWIRPTTGGLYLPVIRLINAPVQDQQGKIEYQNVLTPNSLGYIDLLRGCYGSRSDLKNGISLYNAFKYPGTTLVTPSSLTSDERTVLFLAGLLGFFD